MPDIPKVDLRFVLFHKEKQVEIDMPVIGMCYEYDCLTFSLLNNDETINYGGTQRKPNYFISDDIEAYEVYVIINGVRYLYNK